MTFTPEELYMSARPVDVKQSIESGLLSLACFENDDVEVVSTKNAEGRDKCNEVLYDASGVLLRRFIVKKGQEPWLHSAPSFEDVRVSQKFLFDCDAAANISWLHEAIIRGGNRVYPTLPKRERLCFDIFVVFRIAAGTTISPPYVLDPDIDPDGHVVIRTEDFSSVDPLKLISVPRSYKYFSPILAGDLSQAEQCGILLIAARQQTGNYVACYEVYELALAIFEEMPHCSLDNYELLTDWIEKAEKANYALSCVQELAENDKLYDAAWAAAPYNTHTLESVISRWKREMSKERTTAVDNETVATPSGS